MTAVRQSLGWAVDVVAASAWALAAFFIGARLVSVTGGVLFALAVFVTAMTYAVSSRTLEHRARDLASGACPRCWSALTTEHQHRRWDAAASTWLAAVTSWRCLSCGFEQEESLACQKCPE
jgi:hypothetical protein